MKFCPQCRADNYDNAKLCHLCGAELGITKNLHLPVPSNENGSQIDNESISGPSKLGYWFAAWGCVVLITLIISPANIFAAPFFPIGLFALMPQGEDKAIKAWMTGGFILGWAFYLLLSLILFKAKRRNVFFVVYMIFCTLLLLNLGGCYRTLEAASHIQ